MAEVFYRIKNSEGEYLGITHDSMEWDTARQASTWGDRVSADDMAKFAREHYDPTARVVKTTLRRSMHADAWCGNLRFDDHGNLKAHVFQPFHGQWAYSICLNSHYWQDSDATYATGEAAKAACDDELRKCGWVLA